MATLADDGPRDEHVRRLVLDVVRSLIADEELVTVTLIPGDNFATCEVCASAEAVSVLIGPKGQMARAIRTILAGSGAKMGYRYALDIREV